VGIGPLVGIAGGLIESLFTGTHKAPAPSGLIATQTGQVSPFAQILGSLQHLQQMNPTQYQKVTLQISNNLATASRSVTLNGNPVLGAQLKRLSTDFRISAASGHLPNAL
jgi:hypothetical protein